jgi:hypothetical protein
MERGVLMEFVMGQTTALVTLDSLMIHLGHVQSHCALWAVLMEAVARYDYCLIGIMTSLFCFYCCRDATVVEFVGNFQSFYWFYLRIKSLVVVSFFF